ncbi:unnamed protein product [Rotaria sp. Silwood2]|nr:unnamed protein product [Rotaria sp. Silwood2]CAF3993105.1 unnamed protein product [Rotaria sp. Silwood2]
MTRLRAQANVIKFGEVEEDVYQDEIRFSTGTIGKSDSRKVRMAPIDSRTKAKLSQRTLRRQNTTNGGTTTAHYRKQIGGTASSVIFNSYQGLEIVNPNAAENDKTGIDSQKYFSKSHGFTKTSPSVIPKNNLIY